MMKHDALDSVRGAVVGELRDVVATTLDPDVSSGFESSSETGDSEELA